MYVLDMIETISLQDKMPIFGLLFMGISRVLFI